jgi:hypothetical protein
VVAAIVALCQLEFHLFLYLYIGSYNMKVELAKFRVKY